MSARPVLEGVRVVDVSWVGTGPFAAMQMGFMGAEVIKVESSTRPDSSRGGFFRPCPDVESSPNFNTMNLGKYGVRLNLKKPEGVEVLMQMISVSDIFLENFQPGAAERLGLSYQELRKRRPDIIMLSCSTMGRGGPESEYPGFANVFASLSGLGYLTGYPDASPSTLYDSVDMRVGATLCFAAMAALFHRRHTGRGQHVDIAATEAIAALIGHKFLDYTMNGRVPVRQGNRHSFLAPHNVYPCKGLDRWVSIAVGGEEEWLALRQATGHLERAVDPRFLDMYMRWQHQEALDELLGQWTSQHVPLEVMELLQGAGVAAMPSFNSEDLAKDPHLASRGAFVETRHPKIGAMKEVGPSWRFSESPSVIRPAPHLYGEHNDHVLGGVLGLSGRQRLADLGVFE